MAVAAVLPMVATSCDLRSPAYPPPSPSNYEPVTLAATLDGGPTEIHGARVERPFFETTGVRPLLGRTFTVAEYTSGDTPAVIVSERLWTGSMGADPGWIGRTVELDGEPHAVVGVMPSAFDSPAGASFWIAGPPPPVVFRGVRVFDGEGVIPAATVVLQNRRITQVMPRGQTPEIPRNARIVDGSGKTLLPGLIDAHTHTLHRNYAKAAAGFGVTTQLDMFTELAVLHALKEEQAAGMAADRADLFSAGTLVTAPGGHGTQYGIDIPTLPGPAGAGDFVDARIAEGADYIKIVHDDGSAFGTSMPTLDEATLRAVISAAQARDRTAVVHIGSGDGARTAIDAGADGLVHVFADRRPDPEFGRRVAEAGAFVVPTLAVIENAAGRPGGTSLVDDPVIGPRLLPAEVENLRRASSIMESNPDRFEDSTISMEHALAAVRLLDEAGVPILAGSDAPNPGTTHGASVHRELELLVQAGLTPVEALVAATSAPARAFGLEDRGGIAPGQRADVVLVEGDPTTDIMATRAIAGIWKEGRRWKLELLLEQVAALRPEIRPAEKDLPRR